MAFTTSPSQVKIRSPRGTRSTNTANAACSPTPQAMTRGSILRRLLESSTPMPRIATMPNNPMSLAGMDRGSAGGATGAAACAGAWTVGGGETTPESGRCAPPPVAACTVFQARRGRVNTTSAHTNVTANANPVRRNDILPPSVDGPGGVSLCRPGKVPPRLQKRKTRPGLATGQLVGERGGAVDPPQSLAEAADVDPHRARSALAEQEPVGERLHILIENQPDDRTVPVHHRAPRVAPDDVAGAHAVERGRQIEGIAGRLPPRREIPRLLAAKARGAVVEAVQRREGRGEGAVHRVAQHRAVGDAQAEGGIGSDARAEHGEQRARHPFVVAALHVEQRIELPLHPALQGVDHPGEGDEAIP